jgi:hypothetical protein
MNMKLYLSAVFLLSPICFTSALAQAKSNDEKSTNGQVVTDQLKQLQAIIEDSGTFTTNGSDGDPVHFSAKVSTIDDHSMIVTSKLSSPLSQGSYQKLRTVEIVWQQVHGAQIEREDDFEKSFALDITLSSPVLVTTATESRLPSHSDETESEEETTTVSLRFDSRANAASLQELLAHLQESLKNTASKSNVSTSTKIDSKELDGDLAEIKSFMENKHAPLVYAKLYEAKAGEYHEIDINDEIKRIDSIGILFTRATTEKSWLTKWDGTVQTTYPEKSSTKSHDLKWSDLTKTIDITDTVDGAGEKVVLKIHFQHPRMPSATAGNSQATSTDSEILEVMYPVEANTALARKLRRSFRHLIAAASSQAQN